MRCYGHQFLVLMRSFGHQFRVFSLEIVSYMSELAKDISMKSYNLNTNQGGITCGAIEDPRKSSKAIDERVIINFRDKNGVIARFRDKNVYR